MDAKITKLRLSRMLSYDWLKIIGAAAAVIIVWVLIFTMTATRITSAQTFTVHNYLGNISLTADFSKAYSDAYKNKVFSGEVLETGIVDLAANGEYASQVLEARVATDEGDVMFVSQQPNVKTAYTVEKTNENGEKVKETLYERTYLESFLGGYRYHLHSLERGNANSFFAQMENYLNRYYPAGYESGENLNEKLAEEEFLARIKRTKDKRYKKQSQIDKGIQEEIERIQKYRTALISFYDYLDKGVVSLTKTVYTDKESGETIFEGYYSINLCPDTKTMGGLSSLVGYRTTYEVDGKEEVVVSAKDMNICIFDMNGKEEAFRYEALLYITHLIDSVITK